MGRWMRFAITIWTNKAIGSCLAWTLFCWAIMLNWASCLWAFSDELYVALFMLSTPQQEYWDFVRQSVLKPRDLEWFSLFRETRTGEPPNVSWREEWGWCLQLVIHIDELTIMCSSLLVGNLRNWILHSWICIISAASSLMSNCPSRTKSGPLHAWQ